ncbi:MAG: hypothetical protein KZQ95_01805 [Candidatus Thiodiazotropha sp. (ex Epidulcina cf. delphinae)]|nr:hypothetical protein [Candidatus Thiodiazotropha sp. (ex Epidulcina cf. delphinae)]
MANDSSEERRKVQTFRDKILPTIISAFILSTTGGIVSLWNTVQQHANDLAHFKSQCHMLEERTSDYQVIQHRMQRLEIQLDDCQSDHEGMR